MQWAHAEQAQRLPHAFQAAGAVVCVCLCTCDVCDDVYMWLNVRGCVC